jgi:hypothetical protein
VSGLPQLLDRAASSGRIVVLISDHGHILEHGSQLRTDTSGGARWRAAELPVRPDEVLVAGPRVLTPEGRAILAATEELRYGREAHGYHGGASLAEVAIPLVVLLPPGTDPPAHVVALADVSSVATTCRRPAADAETPTERGPRRRLATQRRRLGALHLRRSRGPDPSGWVSWASVRR